jgi:phosphomannomutase
VKVTIEAEFEARVKAWIADDPDGADRAELQALLDGAGSDAEAPAELRDRFAGRLRFGTAGLRGAVAAGPNRMNRAVVRATTAAVAGWLLGSDAGSRAPGDADVPGTGSRAPGDAGVPGTGSRAPGDAGVPGLGSGPGGGRSAPDGGFAPDAGLGVVVGCDARHRSAEFADETARVLAGAGIAVHMLPLPCPTPLLAFAVRYLTAAAGVMITASHNPAADNGYKLYLSDGAQVIPPADAEIQERIAGLGPLSQIPVADPGSPLIAQHGDEVARAYLDAVVATAVGPPSGTRDRPGLNVVYTPMHGVAGPLMVRAIRQAGFAAPHVVAAQADPDPDFPTVAFPNPEEPGALDLALADARRLGADLVIASDPDGDRLAVAVPRPAGGGSAPSGEAGWLVLTGDQVGALLGASLLEQTAGDATPEARLVASTIVSSTLLAKIAAAAGVRYAETLTGFKWIARAGDAVPGSRFVFGYEEALGYAVGDAVRDKDGIGAALAMLRLAAGAKAAGRSVPERYDELEAEYGVHLTSQLTLRTADQADVMRRLRANPPAELGGQPVTGITDLEASDGGRAAAGTGVPAAGTSVPAAGTSVPGAGGSMPAAGTSVPGAGGSMPAFGTGVPAFGTGVPGADVLIFRLPAARAVLRPSGTEPKIKCYIEVTEPVTGRTLPAARWAATQRMVPLRRALEAVLSRGDDTSRAPREGMAGA